MGASLTTADAVLKEFYGPGIRNQINNDIPWLAQLEKNTRDIEGRRAVLATHMSRNSGIGARAECADLPDAGNQGYAEERIPLKYNYGRIEICGPTLKASKSDRGSFVRVLDSETKGVTADLKRDVNRQAWGTSNGVIAVTGVTGAANVVVLAAATTYVQMQQFEVGMKVDIGTLADPDSVAAGRTITAIDETGETITIDGAAVTTDATHRITRAGSGGTAELTGLQTIVDDTGTLHNIDPTVHPRWVARDTAVGGAISESLMATEFHRIQRAGGGYPNFIAASDGVFRSYANLLQSMKRAVNTLNLKGGYSGLEFTAGGPSVPVVWDRDTPSGSMYFLNTDHIFEFQMSDWDWMEEDGAVLSRVSGKDAYEAVLFKYHEQATDKRNAHGRLTGITES